MIHSHTEEEHEEEEEEEGKKEEKEEKEIRYEVNIGLISKFSLKLFEPLHTFTVESNKTIRISYKNQVYKEEHTQGKSMEQQLKPFQMSCPLGSSFERVSIVVQVYRIQ